MGIIILNAQGELLAGRRKGLPLGEKAWQMPQGGIDEGETPEEAAWRELEEETGITSKDATLLEGRASAWLTYDWPAAWKKQIRHGRDFDGQKQKWFVFELTNPEACPLESGFESDEFEAFQWVTYGWLMENIHEIRREVYQALLPLLS